MSAMELVICSPDSMTAPNWVTIHLAADLFAVFQGGFLNLEINPRGGKSVDHIWIDFAEFRIESGPDLIPEPATILLFGSRLVGPIGFRGEVEEVEEVYRKSGKE